jgi:hypothetical protein
MVEVNTDAIHWEYQAGIGLLVLVTPKTQNGGMDSNQGVEIGYDMAAVVNYPQAGFRRVDHRLLEEVSKVGRDSKGFPCSSREAKSCDYPQVASRFFLLP